MRGPDPRSRPDARRTLLRLERRFPQLLEYISSRKPTENLQTETELTSRDGRIGGTVDLIIIGEQPCIVDYKTGFVLEEGKPVDHYVRQLSLYAHLVEERLGVDLNDAALFSLRDGIIPIDVSRESRNVIVQECLAARETYNTIVPNIQPATPTPMACSYCSFIGGCDDFWGIAAGGMELTTGKCIEGRVEASPVLSASGVGAVALSLNNATTAVAVTVIDIPNEILKHVTVGENIRGWRLCPDPTATSSLRWNPGQSGLVAAE